MQTITVVIIDIKNSALAINEPLIYKVDVANPESHIEAAEAVAVERGRDLGQVVPTSDIIVQFCFAGDVSPLVDYRGQ